MSAIDRFSSRAEAYAASRPSYPPEAIAIMFKDVNTEASLSVADLGAGTGISSRLIADAGFRVWAIEPNAGMRSQAREDSRIVWVDGTAESTTLDDDSVDIVAAFQAWHWFDAQAAVVEARRIARRGGRLVVVYNERDERDAFTRSFGDIVRRYAMDNTEARRAAAVQCAMAIDPSRSRRFDFTQRQAFDTDRLHRRADGMSYLPHSGVESRALHSDIDALLESYAGMVPDMHLLTIVVRVEL